MIDLQKGPNMFEQMIVLQENGEYFVSYDLIYTPQKSVLCLCIYNYIYTTMFWIDTF